MTGIFGAMAKRISKKKLGQVPEPLGLMWHALAGAQGLLWVFPQGQQVESVRFSTEVVRPYGGRVDGGLQLLPRFRWGTLIFQRRFASETAI